jgi:hypothetical protein
MYLPIRDGLRTVAIISLIVLIFVVIIWAMQ